LFVWPYVLIYFVLVHQLPVDAMNGLLTYVGVISSGPIGIYLWQSLTKVKKEDDDELV